MRLWVAGIAVLAMLPPVPASATEAAGAKHAAVADFDGDGRTDLAVLRTDGGWYIQPSGLACCWGFTWGSPLPADARPVPGDYDGNGSADPAMFNPGTGTWQIMPSNGTGAFVVPFGRSGDVPVPGDYDGDGTTDIAVYRDGRWLIRNGAGIMFGVPGDIPVPADYDGDGRTDAAVYRAGTWIVLRSSDGGQTEVTLGAAGDRLVPADYDGDGRADPAVYAGGTWSIQRSGDGSLDPETLGGPGDLPAPGDYDGDGRTDPAVYQQGTWLIAGGQTATLGGAGDVPVAYLP